MTSFMDDISRHCTYGRHFEDRYQEETVATLCDSSASIDKWEEAAATFLNLEETSFNFDFNEVFALRTDRLQHILDLISCLVKLGYENRWDYYGPSLEAIEAVPELVGIIGELACLVVTETHHKSRKLREMSKHLAENDGKASADFVEQITQTVDHVDQALTSMREVDYFVGESLEKVLHDSILDTASRCAILPSKLHIREIQSITKYQVNGGGFADIFNGSLSDGRAIAMKVPRCFGGPEEIRKVYGAFSKEAFVWNYSVHKNILPLFGIGYTGSQDGRPNQLILATPWMNRGSLKQFLRDEPGSDRLSFIKGIANGLLYLHVNRNPPVVHGDLRCDNILVDDNGIPKIADFGLCRVQMALTGSSSGGIKGSLRWLAPELLDPETFGGDGRHTFASDIYAFGMTCLEIITDEVPFIGLSDIQTMTAVMNRRTPTVSGNITYQKNMTKRHWSLIRESWSSNANDRPLAYEIWKTFQ